MWRNPRNSAVVLGGATAAFAVVSFGKYSGIQIAAYLALLYVATCFIWNNVANFTKKCAQWLLARGRTAWGNELACPADGRAPALGWGAPAVRPPPGPQGGGRAAAGHPRRRRMCTRSSCASSLPASLSAERPHGCPVNRWLATSTLPSCRPLTSTLPLPSRAPMPVPRLLKEGVSEAQAKDAAVKAAAQLNKGLGAPAR